MSTQDVSQSTCPRTFAPVGTIDLSTDLTAQPSGRGANRGAVEKNADQRVVKANEDTPEDDESRRREADAGAVAMATAPWRRRRSARTRRAVARSPAELSAYVTTPGTAWPRRATPIAC